MIEALANFGLPAVLVGVLVSVLVWLIKENQRNFEECNKRTERLLEDYTKFARETAEDMGELVNKMNQVTNKVEKLIDRLISDDN